MNTYPQHFSDDALRNVARQWDDDGADGETVHALTREVLRLRAAMRVDRENLRDAVNELYAERDINSTAKTVLLKLLED